MKTSLAQYKKKRDFKKTPEPAPKVKRGKAKKLSFVVQEHHARRLHWDFRLEWEGVLKSWAVPKGPSLDPKDKRLAVQTEDHPLSYGSFEGEIPKGEYGAGQVILWDQGEWIPETDPKKGFKKGHIDFTLKGERLHGKWVLVRTRRGEDTGKEQWLLMKRHDEYEEAAIPKVKKKPRRIPFPNSSHRNSPSSWKRRPKAANGSTKSSSTATARKPILRLVK